ncbi:MAG: hypothetical protein ACYTG7_22320 [Planctomycetota bacterium]
MKPLTPSRLARFIPLGRLALLLLLFFAFTAFAAFVAENDIQQQPEKDPMAPVFGVMQILLILLLFAGLGLGLGPFGFLVNHMFKKRGRITHRVLCAWPRVSLLLGVLITVVGLGLLHICEPVPTIQLLIFLAYIGGLGMFGIGACVRLAARFIASTPDEEVPELNAHIKGGLVLLFSNALPILGNLFFLCILLAGIGAAVLGYFASIGSATAAIASAEHNKED